MNVTSASYFDTLVRLQMVIKEKHCRLLSRGVILHHDNMSSHTTSLTQTLVRNMKWKILKHSSYSPDLTPLDFHVFLSLKGDLGGKHIEMEEELKNARKLSGTTEEYNIG